MGETSIPKAAVLLNATQAPFYADPTGQADATTAIQKALDSAGVRGGGVVYLPAGTYKISIASTNQALSFK